MAIYNLGTLEQPKQEVNPYINMLMQYGLQSSLQQQEITGRKELATAQGEAEAKTFLAKSKMERDDQTRKNLWATWQSWSDKPVNERDMFPTTDSGKEYFKFAKPYMEDMFDEVGKPIPLPSTKDTIKQQLDSAIMDAKNTLISKGPDALTQGQRVALQMEGLTDEAAKVAFSVISNPSFPFLPPEKQTQMLQQAVETLKKTRNIVAPVSAESGISGALNPTPISQEATPQRTRFKVKRIDTEEERLKPKNLPQHEIWMRK